MTLSWFGHMNQQDCSNFFTISTALDLPSNSQWKLKLMLPSILGCLVMKRGPKLAMKMYQKPTHIGCYLHCKSNHPHHVKRGVVHSIFTRAKVICQEQKDFSNEIKIIRHDLMLVEYPQEFDTPY
jgi:hypothetical protein